MPISNKKGRLKARIKEIIGGRGGGKARVIREEKQTFPQESFIESHLMGGNNALNAILKKQSCFRAISFEIEKRSIEREFLIDKENESITDFLANFRQSFLSVEEGIIQYQMLLLPFFSESIF
jgi:hypothetical protein